MSITVDRKYLGLISLNLAKFKQKDATTWNARCPFCGDSKKSTTKARFYIFQKPNKNTLLFTCHNCGKSGGFPTLLKFVNAGLYSDYNLECFQDQGTAYKPRDMFIDTSRPVFEHKEKIDLPTIESLDKTHPAYVYLKNRKIPQKYFSEFYYADDFKIAASQIFPQVSKELMEKDRRIVIPFYDRNKNLLGITGRAIYKTDKRYIIIKAHEENIKLFGYDKLDFTKKVYVFEGPLDSCFIDNSVASMDSGLYRDAMLLSEAKEVVYVYDNEPRNKDIVRNMEKTIDLGYEVCVWPSDIPEKDINEMILAGTNASIINDTIDRNTFSGLQAKLELTRWSKI